MPIAGSPIPLGRKRLAAPVAQPAPAGSIADRLAALSSRERAAYRIRRQWASLEITDDEILRGLERATGRTFLGALRTVGGPLGPLTGVAAAGLAFAAPPFGIPASVAAGFLGGGAGIGQEIAFAPLSVPIQAAVGAGAYATQPGFRKKVRERGGGFGAFLQAETELPLAARVPAEIVVGLGGFTAGALGARLTRRARELVDTLDEVGSALGSVGVPSPTLKARLWANLALPNAQAERLAGQQASAFGLLGLRGYQESETIAQGIRSVFRRGGQRVADVSLPRRYALADQARSLERALQRAREAEIRLAEAQAAVPEFRTGAAGAAPFTEGVSFRGSPFAKPDETLAEQARRAADEYAAALRNLDDEVFRVAGGAADGLKVPPKVANWRPDPRTGHYAPPDAPLRDAFTEMLAQHPTFKQYLIHVNNLLSGTEDELRLALGRNYPIIDRILNLDSGVEVLGRRLALNWWKPAYNRDPVTNAAHARASALTHVRANSDGVKLYELTQGLKEVIGSESMTGLKVKPGVKLPDQYPYEGHIADVISHPADYLLPKPLADWLARHTDYTEFTRKLENSLGVTYEARQNYIFQMLKDRPERFLRVAGAKPRLVVKKGFQKERVYEDLREAWVGGRTLAHNNYSEIMTARAGASGRATAERYVERIAKEYAPDPDTVMREVAGLTKGSAVKGVPILGGIYQAETALAQLILGPDLVAVLGNQVPLSFLRDPLAVAETIGGRLAPGWHAKPLHGFALLKLAVPRFMDPNQRMVWLREHLDSVNRYIADGGNPIASVTGLTAGASDTSALIHRTPVVGKTIEQLTAAQFEGILTPLKIHFYEQFTDHLLGARRSFFTPVGVDAKKAIAQWEAHLKSGLLPKELADNIPVNAGETYIRQRVVEFLDDALGGINPARWGIGQAQQEVERIFGLAPGWLRANVDLLGSAFTADIKGQMARDFLARALMMYTLWGETISLATAGRTMNMTDPTKGDFGGIHLGPDTVVQPLSRVFGPMRAVLGRDLKWTAGRGSPVVMLPLSMARDRDFFSQEPITEIGKNPWWSRTVFAARNSLPVMGQNWLDNAAFGTLNPKTVALQGFGISSWSKSPQQMAVMGTLTEAAIEAGVPEIQARRLLRYGENPLEAKDGEGKLILNPTKQAAAKRRALELAQQQDARYTAEDIASKGRPRQETVNEIWARTRGYWQAERDLSEASQQTLVGLAERRGRTRAGKLPPGEPALSGVALREAYQDEMKTRRVSRWRLDASLAQYAKQNGMAELLAQMQSDGLSRQQQDDVARAMFLYGFKQPDGREVAGFLSQDVYDPLTGTARFEQRDALRQWWASFVPGGEETLERWLKDGRRALPREIQNYVDGLESYRPYFELRDALVAKQPARVKLWFELLEQAQNVGGAEGAAAENLLRQRAPAEARELEAQLRRMKEELRRRVPGLDAWLVEYYGLTPMALRKAA